VLISQDDKERTKTSLQLNVNILKQAFLVKFKLSYINKGSQPGVHAVHIYDVPLGVNLPI